MDVLLGGATTTDELFVGEFGDKLFVEGLDFVANDFTIVNERHFEIQLIEIAIETVGARVFVAEARSDLEVFVKSANHEKLLKLLGGLR